VGNGRALTEFGDSCMTKAIVAVPGIKNLSVQKRLSSFDKRRARGRLSFCRAQVMKNEGMRLEYVMLTIARRDGNIPVQISIREEES